MTGYLLDTNVVSELRKVKPHGAILAFVGNTPPDQLLVSAVTMGEIQSGVELARRNDPAKAIEIESWLSHVPDRFTILPMDTDCFREWARLMVGQADDKIEDAMIAATARVHGLTVATRNERDFQPFDVPLVNPFRS